MTQIPLYRAKKIDSDEYVEGDLFSEKFIMLISILNKKIFSAIKHIKEDVLKCNINKDCKNEHIELKNMLTKLIYNERLEHITEIDPSTLSIHFPDMLANDSDRLLPNGEKDLRIFASLSEDGKGGDIVEYVLYEGKTAISICRYKEHRFYYCQDGIKITGVQK